MLPAVAVPQGRSSKPAPPLRLNGSTTIGEKLAPALVESWSGPGRWSYTGKINESTFRPKNPGSKPVEVTLSAQGSNEGAEALKAGKADIWMSSRPVSDEELAFFHKKHGDSHFEHVIALDGIAIILHKGNRIKSLSRQQIAEIFSGEIKDWSAVGGSPGPIKVYSRDEKSGTYDTFKALILKPFGKKLTPSATPFNSSSDLSYSVSKERAAIGFIGLPYVLKAAPVTINECGISYSPNSFTVKTEEYPLARRLFLYTPKHSPSIDSLVRFALSDKAQKIATEKEFIDLTIDRDPKNSSISRPNLSNSKRLSVTFRFATAHADLDSRAQRDLDRLALFMKSSSNQKHSLALLGFADNHGSDSYNKKLSLERAQAVAKRLKSLGVKISVVRGYGKAWPVACNDPIGSQKNRRVEVWIQ
jgi:phosphate transport system substrate-binding protein